MLARLRLPGCGANAGCFTEAILEHSGFKLDAVGRTSLGDWRGSRPPSREVATAGDFSCRTWGASPSQTNMREMLVIRLRQLANLLDVYRAACAPNLKYPRSAVVQDLRGVG